MLRRLVLLTVPAVAVAAGLFVACGGTKDFNFDAGPGPQAPVDAGPCDVYTQTNCPADLKCTIQPDGKTICGNKGTGGAYEACDNDSACAAGTACVDLQFTGFLAGKHCFPFCDQAKYPSDGGAPFTTLDGGDGGSVACGATVACTGLCPGDATCLALRYPDAGLQISEGFCDTRLDAGP